MAEKKTTKKEQSTNEVTTKKERKPREVKDISVKIQEVDAKIQYHQDIIDKLKAKKELLLNPPKRARKKTSVSSVLKLAKDNGMTVEEIAEKLGLDLNK